MIILIRVLYWRISRKAQKPFAMPHKSDLYFFEPWLKTINDAIIAVKQLTPNKVAKLWGDST